MKCKAMNILVAVDEKYLEPLSVMLYSLVCHNRGIFSIYILHFDIPLRKQLEFQKKTLNWNKGLKNVYFIQAKREDFAGIGEDTRYRQEANLRLLILKLLPVNVSKILWLDIDIIKGNIQEFYEYPDKGQYALVCEDMFPRNEKRDTLKRIGMRQNERYFNSGVMLLYLNNIRSVYDEAYFISFLRNNKQKMKYPDQSVLNICLKRRLVWAAPEIYNLQLLRADRRDKLKIRRSINKAKILHYNTKEKPWDCDYDGILELQYWKYGVRVLGIRRCVQHLLDRMVDITWRKRND